MANTTDIAGRGLTHDESCELVRKLIIQLGSESLAMAALRVIADVGAGLFMPTNVSAVGEGV